MQDSLRTTRLERILSTLGLGRHNKRQKEVGLLKRRISLESLEERMLLSVYHWTGNGSDNNWTTAANWAEGMAPTAGSALVFSGTNRLATYNNANAGRFYNSITFASSGFSISGNSFALTAGITVNSGVTTAAIYQSVTLNASQSWVVNSGTLYLAGNVVFPNLQLLVQGAGAASFSGAVSGYDFRANGGGTATFTGSSSLTTTSFALAGSLSNGTINWNSTGVLLPTCLYVGFGGGVGTFSQTAGAVYADNQWGISMSGAGSTYNLAGLGQAILMTRVISATAGTTLAFRGGRLATFNNANLTPSSDLQYTTNDDFAYLDANGSLSSITLNAPISGNGYLINYGAGTVNLNGVNTYTGFTRSNGGTLVLGNSSALQGSAINLYSGDAGNFSFGSLTSATVGGLMGQRNLSLQNALGSAVALTVGGNNSSSGYSGVLSGSGSLTKVGAGSLTLSGQNTYSGLTDLQRGLFMFGTDNALGSGDLRVSGGTLHLQSYSDTVGALTLVDGTIMGGGALTASSYTVQNGLIATALAGSAALTKTGSGTTTLTAQNTYTGNTIVDAGTLAVEGALSSSSTATVAVNNGGFLAGEGTISRAVSIASGGTLSPADTDVGTITVGYASGAGVAFNSGSTFRVDIDGNATGNYDTLFVNGSVSLDGCTLSVDGDYAPPAGSAITIIDNDGSDAISGQFSCGSMTTVGGVTMTVRYNGGDGNDVVLLYGRGQTAVAGGQNGAASTLAQADLAPIVDAAVALWRNSGVSQVALAKLASVKFAVADLSGNDLGLYANGAVYLDNDAAGWGWFVDSTPGANEEFVGSGVVQQAVDPRAVDRVDLLSVVTHELGHALGSDDLAGDDSVMSGLLAAGTRRTSLSPNDLALLSALD
jgi:fibronectin-binding autotransporter adhesin